MANGHGGKREGAKRPKLPFKTKEIRWRVTAFEYSNNHIQGETYDKFYKRVELAALDAIFQEVQRRNKGLRGKGIA